MAMAMIMKRAANSPVGCSNPSALALPEANPAIIGIDGMARRVHRKYREFNMLETVAKAVPNSAEGVDNSVTCRQANVRRRKGAFLPGGCHQSGSRRSSWHEQCTPPPPKANMS